MDEGSDVQVRIRLAGVAKDWTTGRREGVADGSDEIAGQKGRERKYRVGENAVPVRGRGRQ